jgi:hypothetical protein
MTGVTDRDLLAREAARLLPGGAGLPAASELDLVWPETVPPAVVGALRAGREPDADALRLVVADAYYAHPAVRAALGYPGPRSIPLPPLPDARDAELEPLLERVRARGPIYRGAGGCEPPQGDARSS